MAEERAFGPVRLIPAANQGRYPHSNSVSVSYTHLTLPTSDLV